jgi:hypothetical protein
MATTYKGHLKLNIDTSPIDLECSENERTMRIGAWCFMKKDAKMLRWS